MQSNQTMTNAPVHIKVSFDNEFRRFLLNPVTFSHLETTLKNLFSLESEMRIKFQDDENDWVLLTTDQELVYATELSGSPLRLQVKPLESVTPKEAPSCEGGRGRCGRGGRGRMVPPGRVGCKSPEERLFLKSSRLTERIAQLEAKLSSQKLTSERERVIRWRLAKLQEKLEFVKVYQASLETGCPKPTEPTPTEQSPVPEPEPESVVLPQQEDEKPSARGCPRGRGCGRGGMRLRQGCTGPDQPKWKGIKARMDPELLANFRQCRLDLVAAKGSGDAEKIAACKAAFQAAKVAKWEAMAAIKAESACNADQKA